MAVSCETFLRINVLRKLPSELHSDFVNMIAEANIRQYMSQYFKNLIPRDDLSEYKKIGKELSSPFVKRNKLMRMGQEEGVTNENCERYLRATNKLLSLEAKVRDS